MLQHATQDSISWHTTLQFACMIENRFFFFKIYMFFRLLQKKTMEIKVQFTEKLLKHLR